MIGGQIVNYWRAPRGLPRWLPWSPATYGFWQVDGDILRVIEDITGYIPF